MKSLNFIVALSRTGESDLEKATGAGKCWKSVQTQVINWKCVTETEEN